MSRSLSQHLTDLVIAAERLRRTPVVDDDFPEVMHHFDGELRAARNAIDQAKAFAAAHTVDEPLQPVLGEVLAELARACVKFPTWPDDPLHALTVVGEEYGETVRAALQAVYEPQKASPSDVHSEAVQMAAMSLRFLMSMDRYIWVGSLQHALQSLGVKADAAGST